MGNVFLKRVWTLNKCSVYAQYVDGRIVRYRVTCNRRVLAEFTQRDAALEFANRAATGQGDSAPKHTDELVIARARKLPKGEPIEGSLDARLLAALEYVRLENETRSKARQALALTIGNVVAECGAIPPTEAEAEKWIEAAVEKATAPTNRKLASKSSLVVRVQTLKRILFHINNHGVAFRKWKLVASTFADRVDGYKRGASKSFAPEEQRSPFSLAEIHKVIADCETFEQVCLVGLYLTSGLRAGEAERLHPGAIIQGKLNLKAVVTKTTTSRMPEVSVVFMTCLEFLFERGGAEQVRLATSVDRRRFRPTAAVNLLLGGVPAIRVMERLGHSKLTMLHQHYATMSPPDWGVCRNLTDYLKVSNPVNPGIEWD